MIEDIKKMSDEEFIELVKKAIKEEKEVKEDLPENVICVSPEKFKRIMKTNEFTEYLSCVAVGGLIGVLTTVLTQYFGGNNSKSAIIGAVTASTLVVILPLLQYNDNKKQKKIDAEHAERRKIEIEQELRNNILNLKKLLEGLTDEDLKLLIKNVKVLEQNKINNDIINSSNVLLAANQLIELNATDILSEFETVQAQYESENNYNDDAIDMGYSKNMKESN